MTEFNQNHKKILELFNQYDELTVDQMVVLLQDDRPSYYFLCVQELQQMEYLQVYPAIFDLDHLEPKYTDKWILTPQGRKLLESTSRSRFLSKLKNPDFILSIISALSSLINYIFDLFGTK